eukprot:4126314-Prymnesium_polylepis.3
MVEGLDDVIEAPDGGGLPAVQACFDALRGAITGRGGALRQFIKDDKGMVCIWTFGLANTSYEDNAERGLLAAGDVLAALRAQGLAARIGVTSGVVRTPPP